MNTPIRMTSNFQATKIAYANFGPNHWQHVDCNDPGRKATVGPVYRTKDELLANHEQYLIDGGWVRRPASPVALSALEAEMLAALEALMAGVAGCEKDAKYEAARAVIAKAKGGAA